MSSVRAYVSVHENMNAKCESRIANIHEMLKTKLEKSTAVIKISVDFGAVLTLVFTLLTHNTSAFHFRYAYFEKVRNYVVYSERENSFAWITLVLFARAYVRACVARVFKELLFVLAFFAFRTLLTIHCLRLTGSLNSLIHQLSSVCTPGTNELVAYFLSSTNVYENLSFRLLQCA